MVGLYGDHNLALGGQRKTGLCKVLEAVEYKRLSGIKEIFRGKKRLPKV